MKVTTGKQIKLSEKIAPPEGACLIYRVVSKDDAPLMSVTRIEKHYYVTGSYTPWSWKDLWSSLQSGGGPLELLILLEY